MYVSQKNSELQRRTLKVSGGVFDTDPSNAGASVCAVEHSRNGRDI